MRLRDVRNAPALIRFVDDSLRGRSGSLYARFVIGGGRSAAMPVFAGLFGDSSVRHPGVYSVEGSALSRPFAFVDVRGARGRWGLSQ